MYAILKLVCFWILMSCSSCWLLPHETERRGNSPPLAPAKLVMNGCTTIMGCFNELKSLPNNANRPAFTLLGQGIDRLVISSKLQNILTEASGNFYPYTSHLIELYSATDGVHYTDGQYSLQDLWMFPNYLLLSLEEAVEIYQDFPRDTLKNPSLYPQTEEYSMVDPDDFDFSWFPIMASGMGDYIFIDLSSGQIFEYVPTFDHNNDGSDDNESVTSFSSVLVFLKQVVQHFKSGKYQMVNGVAMEKSEHDQVVHVVQVSEHLTDPSNDENDVTGEDYDVSNHDPTTSGDSNLVQRRVAKAAQKLYNRHGMPLLNLNCRGMGIICNFIQHSINDHGSQRTLCKVRKRSHVRNNNRMLCGPVKRVRGSDCGQFPLESTHHSSAHSSESRVTVVPTVELNVLGGQIRAFYRATEISTRPRKRCFKVASP